MLDELFRRKSVERILKESESQKMEAEHKIPMILFMLVATSVTVLSFVKRLSLIPVLGLLTCFYLMTQLGITNWTRFGIWLAVGLAIYFSYSRKSSQLN